MHANANYRRLKMPSSAVALHAADLTATPDDRLDASDRDEDWEEFLAMALPRVPGDEESGTTWHRTPVMLSY